MDPTLIIVTVSLLAAASFAGVGYAVLGPRFAQRDGLSKRIKSASGRRDAESSARKQVSTEGTKERRRSVQETLKEIEQAQKAKKPSPSLRSRIERAGLTITVRTFVIASIVIGIGAAVGSYVSGLGIWVALAFGFAGALGLPRWFLAHKTKKRQAAFSDQFTVGLDTIVRGVKAGLPVSECLAIVAREAQEPVRHEFKVLVEGQKLGVSLSAGLQRMLERMPTTELNFFVIVLTIQQQTGGNLSESLNNLSNVLRGRKQLRAKVQAMSSEAKASAMIIGLLPFFVTAAIYLTTPDYMSLLFTTMMGRVMIAGCIIWMSIGILVMRKMINFDF